MMDAKSPKCGGQMEEGFVVDRTYGANLQSTWLDGEPQTSFWTGVKIGKKEQVPVTTLRCSGCGYFESFAVPS